MTLQDLLDARALPAVDFPATATGWWHRHMELQQRGTPQPYEQVLSDIQTRDYNDTNRATAPLRQAEDAVLLDTTELNFVQSRDALLAIIREKVSA